MFSVSYENMTSSGSQHRAPYVVAPPPDADQLPSLSQMPSQVPSQMWTEGISSWCHNGQITSASGQMATSGQPRSWEGHFRQTQGQGHESQEGNVYSDQTQTYPVNVPPSGSRAAGTQGFLRPVSLIPEQYRSLFSQFPYFNIVQSTVFDDVFYTDRSLVVSAPTGSGKTVVMELALVRLLMAKATEADAEDVPMPPRVVYMAPMKALVTERYIDWQMRLRELGVICAEITGDTDHDDIAVIAKSQVILTTPEKWDSLTRRWRNHVTLMEAVSLLLIDEVHVLGDQTRGPTMEAVVSRMKTIRTTRPSTSPHRLPLRFVAVSATIPNAEDLAVWLSDGQSPAVTHRLEESLRPVKLRRVVLGYDCLESWSEFRFDLSLTYALATVIATYSENKPTLVFASTRKGAQIAASTLSKEARLVRNSSHKQLLTSVGNLLRDNKLRECLLAGVAYHHAGLDMADRRQVEELFTSGHLPVLVSTSTLAMGVNLPAHLVVVKSTSQYNGSAGGHEEYSTGQILQMIGRAGRPQFDRHATAVIMTKRQLKVRRRRRRERNQERIFQEPKAKVRAQQRYTQSPKIRTLLISSAAARSRVRATTCRGCTQRNIPEHEERGGRH
ncbi:probable ATP-dependent DNA helicase HFM1 [Penaeus chinensis]|uniref:probable ATP-dependent DNA helicase HFM1 n=1 Tax=Penaeus chinensis TaxID=139456 RepID=UPI001FB6C223|nr:probable ATP-dependent DNA helicase HFM1 [Penaeus chinensis]